MNIKQGKALGSSKVPGFALLNYAKNRPSSSLSTQSNTMNEEQSKIIMETSVNHTKQSRGDYKQKTAADIKEETINFTGKRTNEVILANNKSTMFTLTNMKGGVQKNYNSSAIDKKKHSSNSTNHYGSPSKNNVSSRGDRESDYNTSVIHPYLCSLSPKKTNASNELTISYLNETTVKESRSKSLLKFQFANRYSSLDKLQLAKGSIYGDNIKIEELLILEEKLFDIIKSIDNKKTSSIECYEWWSFYFNSSLSGEKYEEFFSEGLSTMVIHTADNLAIFSVLFYYYISEDLADCKKYNSQMAIIFSLLHKNYLYICRFITKLFGNKGNNSKAYYWLVKLNTHLKKELGNDYRSDLLEIDIIELIKLNSKTIVETMRIVIDKFNKRKIYDQLCYHFNNLTKLSNENLRDFFRDEIYYGVRIDSQPERIVEIKRNKTSTTPIIKAPYLPNRRLKPYTLVLDLDETLINTKVRNDTRGVVIFRPGLIEFLKGVKEYYEMVSFTAASQDYAESILESIEENEKFFDYKLYQGHTTIDGKDRVKDISLLGRDLSSVIIVDNMAHCFKLQKANGILIKSFYGEKGEDLALSNLLGILVLIAQEKGDVRKSIQKYKNELLNKVASNMDKTFKDE